MLNSSWGEKKLD